MGFNPNLKHPVCLATLKSCDTHCANTPGKVMNPTIFLTIDRQTGLFNLGMVTSLVEGKFWIQNC